MVLSLDTDDDEVKLLITDLYQCYGYDFRNYAFASLNRRVQSFLRSEKILSTRILRELILCDRSCAKRLFLGLTVNTTSMFRDPSFYAALRTQVVPILRTYPFIRIWHAGCSTGQEAYSMAILLQEAGIYHRCRIYATDTNEEVLGIARTGIYFQKQMQEYTQLYIKAGGQRSFSEYYTANYGSAVLCSSLKEHLIFGQHNLVTDRSFNEFNIIICRNVLIYFNQTLQNQVHDLFYNSLCSFGILGLGRQETIRFTNYENHYEVLARSEKLYRRNY